MNTFIRTSQGRSILPGYREDLDRKYSPSTFKHVNKDDVWGSLLNSYFLLFFSSVLNNSKNFSDKKEFGLYLNEDDVVIDEKEIENDLAVVSKDLVTVLKRKYDTD